MDDKLMDRILLVCDLTPLMEYLTDDLYLMMMSTGQEGSLNSVIRMEISKSYAMAFRVNRSQPSGIWKNSIHCSRRIPEMCKIYFNVH